MLLECRRIRISVPKSNEVSFVFPFNQFACKLNRKNYDPKHIDSSRYSKEEIEEFLDKIEKSCHQFKKMRRYTILEIVTLLLFIALIIVGNILLNLGLAKGSDTGDIELAKFRTNGFVISGAASLFFAIVFFIVVTVFVARNVRKLRLQYETITIEMVNNKNQTVKENGLRWKIGRCFNWVELSLDYKIQSFISKTSTFTNSMLRKTGSFENENIPLAIQ